MTRIQIDPRFCGPPGTANGGYFAGLLAGAMGGSDICVTLKAPAPLGEELLLQAEGDRARLFHGDLLLAEAERESVRIDVPAPVSPEEAQACEQRFPHQDHIYPGCFVCGPARDPGDGWRIFPGPLEEGRVAARWVPPLDAADDKGEVRTEFVWAALDCPGYFALGDRAGRALLGRMAAHLFVPIAAGEEILVSGWAIESEGRKHRAGTALHDRQGRLLAAARQTWISLR